MILAYLPEPQKHRLWNEIERLLSQATDDDVSVLDDNELVWIAFEGTTLFGVATTCLMANNEAWILSCAGFEHRKWIGDAIALATRWAVDCGARKIAMRGRMGWARYFRAAGWAVSRSDDGKCDYSKEL